jgi:hypothetical protein
VLPPFPPFFHPTPSTSQPSPAHTSPTKPKRISRRTYVKSLSDLIHTDSAAVLRLVDFCDLGDDEEAIRGFTVDGIEHHLEDRNDGVVHRFLIMRLSWGESRENTAWLRIDHRSSLATPLDPLPKGLAGDTVCRDSSCEYYTGSCAEQSLNACKVMLASSRHDIPGSESVRDLLTFQTPLFLGDLLAIMRYTLEETHMYVLWSVS